MKKVKSRDARKVKMERIIEKIQEIMEKTLEMLRRRKRKRLKL